MSQLTAALMGDPVIERFAESGSFDAARAAWPHVARLPREAWTEDRIARATEAAQSNTQLLHGVIDDGSGREFPVVLDEHLRALGVEA